MLGYPIDVPRRAPNGQILQFYERAIMEWHPEKDVEYQVLLARLGAFYVEDTAITRQPPVPCSANCNLFGETNHTLRDEFRDYWLAYGGLAVFGFPLTEQLIERNQADGQVYTVQYFERNRFEYHPENQGRYRVLLGRLGAEVLDYNRGQVASWPIAQVPNYSGKTPTPTPPPTSAATQFKSQLIAYIDPTFPPLQEVLNLCPGANPLVCQAKYDEATRAYNQLGNRLFDMGATVPKQCENLLLRVIQLRSEGAKWLNAPYTKTPQGFINRNDAIQRAYQAGLWLAEARRVVVQEPGNCQ